MKTSHILLSPTITTAETANLGLPMTRPGSFVHRWLRLGILTLAVLMNSVTATAAQTIVSLTFDDGLNQSQVLDMLLFHGMKGTFYINSNLIDSGGGYLTKAELDALVTYGNEIGGHTIDHVDLAPLSDAQQQDAICDDLQTLNTWYPDQIHSFAYPFASTGPTTQSLLAAGCPGVGTYTNARTVGGLVSGNQCTDCATAESIPPANPYFIYTPESILSSTTLDEIKTLVTQAENNGGGWVPLVFHQVCNGCDLYSVSEATLEAFLTWLQAREGNDTYVRTVNQVMTGDLMPPPTNSPPITLADSYGGASDTTLNVSSESGVLSNDTDVDADTLQAILDTGTTNGTITLWKGGAFRYIPNPGFSGVDSFTYHAFDGKAAGNTVQVTLNINASVNTAPVTVADSYGGASDTTLNVPSESGVLSNDTDVDADTLQAVLDTGTTNGTITLWKGGAFRYVPNPGFSGVDSFTYHAFDGTAAGNTVQVTLNISGNATPVTVADSYNGVSGATLKVTSLSGVLSNDTDADGDALRAVLDTGTSNGTVTLWKGGAFSYSPNPGFSGTDSFTYHAMDGESAGNTVEVTLIIAAP